MSAKGSVGLDPRCQWNITLLKINEAFYVALTVAISPLLHSYIGFIHISYYIHDQFLTSVEEGFWISLSIKQNKNKNYFLFGYTKGITVKIIRLQFSPLFLPCTFLWNCILRF